jgi:hypothetical protein
VAQAAKVAVQSSRGLVVCVFVDEVEFLDQLADAAIGGYGEGLAGWTAARVDVRL